MIVRFATADDRVRVIGMMRSFFEASGIASRGRGPAGFSVRGDPAYAARLFEFHVRSPRAVCLLLQDGDTVKGMLMACVEEDILSPTLIARETMWWIEPESRGRSAVKMLDAYRDWAKLQGCAAVSMAAIDERTGLLYERRGYKRDVVHRLKELDGASAA